jgi:hypothetical protein
MNRQDLQNKKLDEIGRRLLETARVPDAELDRIAASPKLFDAVKAAVKAEQRERRSKTFFGEWRSLLVWNRQKTFASLAVLTLFALGSYVLTKQDSSPILARQIDPPQINLPVAPAVIPPVENSEATPQIVETKNFERKKRVIFQKAVFKNETAALPRQKPPRKNSVKPQIEPEGEFYALTHTGIAGETGENLRVVRAELSRSSLFALGVNLPIENESEKIKTDLLVGADGIAKAIRFVK